MSENSNLDLAKSILLEPTGLDSTKLNKLLGGLLTKGIDIADIYFQAVQYESWGLEDSKVKHGSYSVSQGVGIRAVSQEKTGYAYSDELAPAALTQAAQAAHSIVQAGQNKIIAVNDHCPIKRHNLYLPNNPLTSINDLDKIKLLEQVEAEAKEYHSAITRVEASLTGCFEVVLIINQDGCLVPDIRPLVRLNVMVVAEQNGRIEQASSGGGARDIYQFFINNKQHLEYARDAARQAVLNLSAAAAPAGIMPVVLGPGWPGVLLHEAVGHGLEGDFNRKGSSVFSGRLGEQVASEQCSVVDDGTIAGRRGSLNIDDEGVATQKTMLIENGKLCNYMQDQLNARLMGMKATGNGRRESYAHAPMPRMTNTYMLPGKYTPEEIISSVKRGLYAVNFSGGQVDITSGKFVFSASEAYLIENGKITQPVKGATLIGDGPTVLTKVSMVGNDLQLDSGIGTCGKDGQQVPVGVGQPTLKVDQLVVGGSE